LTFSKKNDIINYKLKGGDERNLRNEEVTKLNKKQFKIVLKLLTAAIKAIMDYLDTLD